MSGKPKTLQTDETEETTEDGERRELYLRDGRTLTLGTEGTDDLVEIRSSSGQVEVRIRMTEAGPVLQMEAARLQLKATEAVEIESKRVEIRATEGIAVESGEDVTVEGKGEVRVRGKMIYLN